MQSDQKSLSRTKAVYWGVRPETNCQISLQNVLMTKVPVQIAPLDTASFNYVIIALADLFMIILNSAVLQQLFFNIIFNCPLNLSQTYSMTWLPLRPFFFFCLANRSYQFSFVYLTQLQHSVRIMSTFCPFAVSVFL